MRIKLPDDLPEVPEGVTGLLVHWQYNEFAHCFTGGIVGDRKKRFADGELIHTSMCHNPDAKDGDIIRTRNSSYLLHKKWND